MVAFPIWTILLSQAPNEKQIPQTRVTAKGHYCMSLLFSFGAAQVLVLLAPTAVAIANPLAPFRVFSPLDNQ
jgi:hypothetical protein